jgi:hypothetical protein
MYFSIVRWILFQFSLSVLLVPISYLVIGSLYVLVLIATSPYFSLDEQKALIAFCSDNSLKLFYLGSIILMLSSAGVKRIVRRS